MVRLPISGELARWRPSSGYDDVALADSRPGLAGALAHVSPAVDLPSGLDAESLPVGDLDLLVVARRRELRGDSIVAEGSCAQCGALVDVQFSLAAYADHHRPRASRVAVASGDGWFTLRSADISFRPPRVADVLAAVDARDPRSALLASCTRGAPTARQSRTVERALATVAPTLRADVAGTCPECAAPVLLDVDARELCMTELRFLAVSVFDDVNLLASVYHWSHDAILGLPTATRRRYADLIAGRSRFGLEVPVA